MSRESEFIDDSFGLEVFTEEELLMIHEKLRIGTDTYAAIAGATWKIYVWSAWWIWWNGSSLFEKVQEWAFLNNQ